MIGLRIALLKLSLLIALPYVPLRAAEIEGVRFTDSVRVADRQLALRSYDLLRYMIVVKAYIGAYIFRPKRRRTMFSSR